MHNEVKQCFCGSNPIWRSSPEAGNLNGRNSDMCSDVAGPSSSGSGDLFELSDRSSTTYFYYFPYY